MWNSIWLGSIVAVICLNLVSGTTTFFDEEYLSSGLHFGLSGWLFYAYRDKLWPVKSD